MFIHIQPTMTSSTDIFKAVREASRKLNLLDDETISKILLDVADEAVGRCDCLLKENARDLAALSPDNPRYDRLKLTRERISDMAEGIRQVAALPSPLGKELSRTIHPNGLCIRKISVPFGVIGIIYEARPNVTFDVFSLCLKSGNACILKGGSEACHSNRALMEVINSVLKKYGIDSNTAVLLSTDHESTRELLEAAGYVDLIIPRGSSRLISFVREHSRIPVIETGAGICHTYFDRYGDTEKGTALICNAKTRRVSVCNALDCLIIHRDRLADLPALCAPLAAKKVILYADAPALEALKAHYPGSLLCPATEESFGTEFLDYKMSVKTVAAFDEALRHIARYSSRHSECIVTENEENQRRFLKEVDAACVYVNASTAFTDGGQFGFGAEIGISTQKLHARGPMGLPELTTYKYLISGNGQIRN